MPADTVRILWVKKHTQYFSQIRAELEKMDLFVRTCQLATTREPGKILGWVWSPRKAGFM